jgi:hypothetical protein
MTDELNKLHEEAMRYRATRHGRELADVIDALRLLVELIQDIRVRVEILKAKQYEKEENNG